jgi:aryl-alcohol dehydrogenase-like predicted oxidoreductase
MKYTTLGKTGLQISRIGFGAWGIGQDLWQADDTVSKQSLLDAYANGVTFFDTALAYANGHSERLIAEALTGKNIVVATKVPPLNFQWPAKDPDISHTFPKEYIIEKARESYANLGKRTIDVLQLHVWLDDWFESNEWRDAFAVLRKEGIVKFFGVSINNHDPDSALKIVASGEIDTIQVIYNIFDQSPKETLFPLAKKNSVGIIARVPLDEGSLTGAFTYETTFTDWRKDYFTPERLKLTVDKVNAIKEKLATPERSVSQIALQFTLLDDGADVAIVGMRNPKHVIENVKSTDVVLTQEEIEYLKTQKWLRNFYI